jgi:hypothetical protein
MIGRAAQGRPWIFREIAHFLETGTHRAPPLVAEVRRLLLDHLVEHYALYGDYSGVRTRAQAHRLVRAHAARRRGVSRAHEHHRGLREQLRAVGDYFDGLADRMDRMPAARRRTTNRPAKRRRLAPSIERRREEAMSKKHIEDCVRTSLDSYFRDLRGTEPDGMYEMLVRVVEKAAARRRHDARRRQPVEGRAMAGPEPQHAAQEAGRAQTFEITPRHIHGSDCTHLRFRQDRHPRIRPGAARAGHQAAVHRRHRQAAGRCRPAGDRSGRPHRLSRNARRPREDAAPEDPRRPAGAPRRARARGGHQGTRHRHHRPAGGQPLPVRSHRGQARLHAGRRDREHRHRRPGHGAQRGQELEGRGRADRRLAVRRGAGRTEGRRQAQRQDQVRVLGGRVQPHRRLRRRHQRLPLGHRLQASIGQPSARCSRRRATAAS